MNKTEVKIIKPGFSITPEDNIFSLGSCFSLEVSKLLKKNGINNLSNPFGTVYNIHNIYNILKRIVLNEEYTENDLFYENGFYFSPDHSTSFDNKDKDLILKKIKNNFDKSREFIKKSRVIIITPGTSFVWLYKDNIVSNCHRLPEKLFIKKILSVKETSDYLKKTIKLLNENLKDPGIVLTVSPVRQNLIDLAANSYSKSILRAAVGEVAENKNVCYFPSYEIVLDELRDYSFYKNDMIHLNMNAVDHVYKKFSEFFFDGKMQDYILEFNRIKNGANHRFIDLNSEKTIGFIDKLIIKIRKLEKSGKNFLLENIKLTVMGNVLKMKNLSNKSKMERLELLFVKDTGVYKFFELVINEDLKGLKDIKIKNRKLARIRNNLIVKNFLK